LHNRGGKFVSSAGQKLKKLREQLGFTIREVEAASSRIAARHKNEDFAIPLSRLSDIEKKSVTPGIFRLYTLSAIYRRDLLELMSWYGIEVNDAAADIALCQPPRSHLSDALANSTMVQVPLALDPGFDTQKTMNLGRMIQQWGLVPLNYLSQFLPERHTYGYLGLQDFTMFPLLLPGSFVQIDESRCEVEKRLWRSEYERPIYFIETREGFVCSWCSVAEDKLVIQPHPLSPVAPRTVRHTQDSEILGQVIGVAMRLGDWTTTGTPPLPGNSGRQSN
jgi:transcriptional regulator with XRE-family HTH domain